MPPVDEQAHQFYPAYCFHLSPTYNTWVRLRAIDVHNLKQLRGFEGQNLFFHTNHPIRYVRLVGIVVAFDVLDSRFVFAIDDSSGSTIDVACERPKPALPNHAEPNYAAYDTKSITNEIPMKGLTSSRKEIDISAIEVGSIVKIKGLVNIWWGEKQIKLERFWIVGTTDEEVNAWEETQLFLKSILFEPWMLSKKEVERAERKSRVGEHRHDKRKAVRRPQHGSERVKEKQNIERSVTQYDKESEQQELVVERMRLRQRERQDREKALLECSRVSREEGSMVGKDHLQQINRSDLIGVSSRNTLALAQKTDFQMADEIAQKEKARKLERKEREEFLRAKLEPSRGAKPPLDSKNRASTASLNHNEEPKQILGINARSHSSDDHARAKMEQAMRRRAEERAQRERQFQRRIARE